MKKNILIFGCNSAIIRSAIKKFLRKNFNVIGISKSNKTIFQKNKNFTYIKFDIEKSNIFKICKKIDKIMDIDSIIYAIGGSKGKHKLLHSVTEWKVVLWYNFGYSIEVNNFFLEKMKKKKYGRILYFSTTAVNLKSGPAIYSSTKAALEEVSNPKTDKYFKYCPYYVQLSLVNMYPHFISKFSLLDQNITARSNPAKYFIYCDIKVKIQLANEYPNYIIAKKKIN